MITDGNVSGYIDSLYKDGTDFAEALRKRAEEDRVPVIRRQTEGFLRSLLLLKKPERILEIGTGTAYSAIFMAGVCPKCTVTTIENYEPRIAQAEKNIEAAGLSERIRLIKGDAAEVLPSLPGSYDFIFLDGPKGQYLSFLGELLRLLENGGILLADNVLQGGSVAMPRYSQNRRGRTIHSRLRGFLFEITHNDELDTCIVPVGDGVSLSIKI